ncbi:hypothetical protein BKA62DRAFT_719486 [Auriculariales sp. MPI-PUGE-AT-0066]|nr:hypothetical protein BKA62DRAFT_719486 [Auriculariales sp. MPI-PUGE-AT-0066]
MSSESFPFAPVPAPWTLHGEVYWMVLSGSALLPRNAQSPRPPQHDELLDCAYQPLERPSADRPGSKEQEGRFVGGLGMVWVVRYTESPVGPYDELIYIPGDFVCPDGTTSPRITTIYVSSPESVWNGRRNWNIPKHLARFSFTKQDDGSTLVKIYNFYDSAPEESQHPFFAAQFNVQRYLPSIPLSTRPFLNKASPHPPLSAGPADRPEECATDVSSGETKPGLAKGWTAVRHSTSGPASLIWWSPAPHKEGGKIAAGEYADGVGFPKVKVWSAGIWMGKGTTVLFGEPEPVRQA